MGVHIAQCDADTTCKGRVGHVSIVKHLATCTFVIYCLHSLLEEGDSTIDYFVTMTFMTASSPRSQIMLPSFDPWARCKLVSTTHATKCSVFLGLRSHLSCQIRFVLSVMCCPFSRCVRRSSVYRNDVRTGSSFNFLLLYVTRLYHLLETVTRSILSAPFLSFR